VAHALARHVALIGFMGAGKTTVGEQLARLLGRPFADSDTLIEKRSGKTVAQLFDEEGEGGFRVREGHLISELLAWRSPGVFALGGGSPTIPVVRKLLAESALTIVLDIDVETAWSRAQSTPRPLAGDEGVFRQLYQQRKPLYSEVADASAEDVDGAVLAAAGIRQEEGSLARLAELVPPGERELLADATVLGLHGTPLEAPVHALRSGEEAKSLDAVERIWRELRLGRDGTIVAFGGGCTTDAAGFAAATYLRGVPWVAVPTTLVGQVDAAIGGKTAVNLPEGKNLVGAFHWPVRTVMDPALLGTLPERERRAGMAEVVKTGLLAGEALWELPLPELVRRCAAYKAAICLRDPHEQGERATLNLGHTFAHALESAAGYEGLGHGEAVALGLLAALRLSGLETAAVEEVLEPRPARVNREAAWAALARDKKARNGKPRLVLLEALGEPVTGVELPEERVRAALDELIAD
jgi:shikimate kinase / 3-dehydroquinate synthase